MSSECSSFVVLRIRPYSPLSSILFLLPKDQTLKRTIKVAKESPCVAEHFSPRQTTETLSPYDLVSSRGSHKRLQTSILTRRPRSVVTEGVIPLPPGLLEPIKQLVEPLYCVLPLSFISMGLVHVELFIVVKPGIEVGTIEVKGLNVPVEVCSHS